MNIVIVTPFFNENPYRKSGLVSLAGELSKYEKVIIISSKIEGTKSKEVLNPNLIVYRFTPTFFFSSLPYTLDLFLFIKIFKICKKINCDILIGYGLQFFSCFSAAIASKLGKYPFFCRIVGVSRTTKKVGIDIVSRIYDYTFALLTLKLADKILIQTKRMKKRPLSLGTPLSKVSVVEDGIDIRRFSENNDIEYLKKEFNIDDSKIVIIFASRLYKLKGCEDLISVAKEIVKEYTNVVFLIVGSGALENKLKNKAKTFDNIIFLGYRTDVPNLLALSDIFVLPSYSEGLSPAVLEACASGLPVVTTSVGSNPDIITNGKNGFLIRPGDRKNLKKYLSMLVENKKLRDKQGIINREFIQNNFNLSQTTLKFLAELKNLKKIYYLSKINKKKK